MMKHRLSACLLPLLLTTILLAGCSLWGKDEAHIVVLYSTDIHGCIFPYDFIAERPVSTSMANMSSYAKRMREDHKDGVILIDGGDLTQGSPAMYYFNYVAMRRPHLAARAVNLMQYDAVVMGNHDLEAGPHVYADRLPRQMDMPILAANAIDARTGDPMFRPYTIVERQGYRIAIIGFITPAIHQWVPKSIWPNLKFNDMITTAEYWLPIIRETEKPDVVIGVFHAGSESYTMDENNQTKERPDGALETLLQVRGFDLALLGHDHQRLNTHIVNNYGDSIPALEPASHAEEMGRADIFLSRDIYGKAKFTVSTQNVEMHKQTPDLAFTGSFRNDYDSITTFLDMPIGNIGMPLCATSALTGPSTLIDFIQTVQLDLTGAEISMSSATSMFNDIPEGPITMRRIFSMYKYENLVNKIWMTGADVKQFLEWGYGRQFNQMKNADDHVLSFQKDAKGRIIYGNFGPEMLTPQYNFTSAAGINYTVDISKPAGHRVTIHSMADGSEFKPSHKYSVAINSYQASGGGGFLTSGLGWSLDERHFHTLTESTKDICYYIASYIQKHGTVYDAPHGEWHVEPAEWWQKGQQRDQELLLPYLTGRSKTPLMP